MCCDTYRFNAYMVNGTNYRFIETIEINIFPEDEPVDPWDLAWDEFWWARNKSKHEKKIELVDADMVQSFIYNLKVKRCLKR